MKIMSILRVDEFGRTYRPVSGEREYVNVFDRRVIRRLNQNYEVLAGDKNPLLFVDTDDGDKTVYLSSDSFPSAEVTVFNSGTSGNVVIFVTVDGQLVKGGDESKARAEDGQVITALHVGEGDWIVQSPRYLDVNTAVFSGGMGKSVFTTSHNLLEPPTEVILTAQSSDATGQKHVDNKTDTDFDIVFSQPPPVGTNNIVLSYFAS